MRMRKTICSELTRARNETSSLVFGRCSKADKRVAKVCSGEREDFTDALLGSCKHGKLQKGAG